MKNLILQHQNYWTMVAHSSRIYRSGIRSERLFTRKSPVISHQERYLDYLHIRMPIKKGTYKKHIYQFPFSSESDSSFMSLQKRYSLVRKNSVQHMESFCIRSIVEVPHHYKRRRIIRQYGRITYFLQRIH